MTTKPATTIKRRSLKNTVPYQKKKLNDAPTRVQGPLHRMPKVVGNYQVGERLASGGMAEIYRATPIKGEARSLVIKAIHTRLATDPLYRSMFVREARLCAHLNHPNIVTLLDFFAGTSGLFLVFECVEGLDLRRLLKTCAASSIRIPPSIAAYLVAHLCEALDYAHTLEIDGKPGGIVHRDLSPSNILLSWRGRLKLADFGVAETTAKTPSREKALLTGKFGYMSPEQVRGESLDSRSDIFSAGVVLAELLMCQRLFLEKSTAKLLVAVDNANVDRLDCATIGAPAELIEIAKRALCRDRNERIQSAGELRDELTDWLGGQSIRTDAAVLTSFLKSIRPRLAPF